MSETQKPAEENVNANLENFARWAESQGLLQNTTAEEAEQATNNELEQPHTERKLGVVATSANVTPTPLGRWGQNIVRNRLHGHLQREAKQRWMGTVGQESNPNQTTSDVYGKRAKLRGWGLKRLAEKEFKRGDISFGELKAKKLAIDAKMGREEVDPETGKKSVNTKLPMQGFESEVQRNVRRKAQRQVIGGKPAVTEPVIPEVPSLSKLPDWVKEQVAKKDFERINRQFYRPARVEEYRNWIDTAIDTRIDLERSAADKAGVEFDETTTRNWITEEVYREMEANFYGLSNPNSYSEIPQELHRLFNQTFRPEQADKLAAEQVERALGGPLIFKPERIELFRKDIAKAIEVRYETERLEAAKNKVGFDKLAAQARITEEVYREMESDFYMLEHPDELASMPPEAHQRFIEIFRPELNKGTDDSNPEEAGTRTAISSRGSESKQGQTKRGQTERPPVGERFDLDDKFPYFLNRENLEQLDQAIADAIRDEAHRRKDEQGVSKLPKEEFQQLSRDVRDIILEDFFNADEEDVPNFVKAEVRARLRIIGGLRAASSKQSPRTSPTATASQAADAYDELLKTVPNA